MKQEVARSTQSMAGGFAPTTAQAPGIKLPFSFILVGVIAYLLSQYLLLAYGQHLLQGQYRSPAPRSTGRTGAGAVRKVVYSRDSLKKITAKNAAYQHSWLFNFDSVYPKGDFLDSRPLCHIEFYTYYNMNKSLTDFSRKMGRLALLPVTTTADTSQSTFF